MSEQGLKAVIYPEIDELGLQDFIRKIQERLSNTFVSMGVNTPQQANGSGTATGNAGQTAIQPAQASDQDNENAVKSVAEGVKKANKEEVEQTPEITEKKQEATKKGLGEVQGKVMSVATSLISGGMSIAQLGKKVIDFLEGSSPALKAVLDLFQVAFNMIWQPVGTIIARELMPKMSAIMQDIAQWTGEIWDEFQDTGDLGSIIKKAIEKTFDLLEDYFDVIFNKILWPIFEKLAGKILEIIGKPVLDILSPMFGILDLFGVSFDDIVSNLEKVWNFITEIFGPVVDAIKSFLQFEWDMVVSGIESMVDVIKKIWEFLSGQVESALGETMDFIEDPVSGLQEQTVNRVAGGDSYHDIGQASREGIVGLVKFGLGSLGLFAEGGIVTGTTPAIVGEAGPEAIIPLDRLGEVIGNANKQVGNIGGGGNVMNFYIQGNNAMEIGDEVSRVLEKTVGKANSKMMWW